MTTETIDWNHLRAARVVGDVNQATSPYVFTCEHASAAVPWSTVDPSDANLLTQHWGWDIGAGDIVSLLCHQLSAVGVLSEMSRLVIDVNRIETSSTLIVTDCDGVEVQLNQALSAVERAARLTQIHGGYHRLVEETIRAALIHQPRFLVAVHSFTPVWRGVPRTMEIGVLFDRYEREAIQLQGLLNEQGFKAVLNEPYSGLNGELLYSANRHGGHFEIPYLELEIRQDLISHPESIADVGGRIARALSSFTDRRL